MNVHRICQVDKMIILTTPKGESILLNFRNVVYCHKTHNNNTSLKFNYGLGLQNKGAYIVVVENYDEIIGLLT